MALTNPPPMVAQFSTQLAACADWPGGAATNHHYPKVDWASATLPLAVIEEETNAGTMYAAGAGGLLSGTLKATIHLDPASATDGDAETLARTLCAELLAQTPGIIFRSAETSLSGTDSMAEQASGTGTIAIQIVLQYGLTA